MLHQSTVTMPVSRPYNWDTEFYCNGCDQILSNDVRRTYTVFNEYEGFFVEKRYVFSVMRRMKMLTLILQQHTWEQKQLCGNLWMKLKFTVQKGLK